MSKVDLVKEITGRFARNADDAGVLAKHFAPAFVHWANGKRSDLEAYAAHLAGYRATYESFSVPSWDEAFEAGDKVVVAYTLEAKRKAGGIDRIPVMAIWQIRDGKVVSLREVDGPASA